MKALTLCPPYAFFVAHGDKTIETRSWATKHRGPLAIAASATVRGRRGDRTAFGAYEVEKDRDGFMVRGDSLAWPYRLPTGSVVAIANLVDCVPMVDRWPDGGGLHPCLYPGGEACGLSAGHGAPTLWRTHHPRGEVISSEVPYGIYGPGRWAWLLQDVQRLTTPIPAKGRLGLWDWDPPANLRTSPVTRR